MARYVLLFLVLLLGSFTAMAQSSVGSLEGRILDAVNKQPLMFATVAIYKAGSESLETGTNTDIDGNYSLSNLDPGKYDVKVSYTGYGEKTIADVTVFSGEIMRLNIELSEGIDVQEVVVVWVEPLIRTDNTTQGKKITSEDISNLPSKSINGIVSTTAGVTSTDDGQGFNVRGGRENSTIVYVDGVRYNSNQIPQTEVEQLEVMIGGIGAAYGDVTSGVISITTKGPSEKFSGNFEIENSNFLDPYGYLLGYASFSGPLIKKMDEKYGGEKSILGYRLGVQYLQRGDRNPSAGGVYKVKDDVYADLVANPVTVSTNGSLGIPKEYYLTDDDVELSPIRENNADKRLDVNGKLDLRVNSAIDMSFGGGGLYNQFNEASGARGGGTRRPRTLTNYHNNPFNQELQYRGYGRFRHRIDSDTSSVIQNLSYILQVSYERRKDWRMNEVHKDNFFDYGHAGTYDWIDTFQTTLITSAIDPVTGDSIPATQWVNLRTITGFTPSTKNPGLAAYNAGFTNLPSANDLNFENFGNQETGDGFWAYNGRSLLDNGVLTHDIFDMVNNPYNNYRKRDFSQIQFNVTGSFEFVPGGNSKNGKHSVEFGLLYEQRVNRSWEINPRRLWLAGRQLLNAQHPGTAVFTGEYTTDPITGAQVPVFDRVPIDNLQTAETSQQTYFDEQVRNKFGYSRYDFIHLDEISPDDLTLDLFSPADLVNTMPNDIDYYGYDAYGNILDGTTTFSDFWTSKDADGNRLFPVAPDQPIYTAAYIQDKFSYKDIIFRVGLRVDRYDANTKVLKDKYSFFGVTTVADYVAEYGDEGIPDNIGDDFVVYGDDPDFLDAPGITAFRNGDDWFNSEGVFQNNVVTGLSSGDVNLILPQDVQTTDVTSEDYNFEAAFRDAIPQVSVMPRLAFSFPINEKAGFFAHYDVLTQRAPSNTRTSALDYYRIQNTIQNSSTGNLNNPELKPEKTIDYEVGFQQLLSEKTAMKVSLYYKELRDLIQSQYYYFAAPGAYFGFGNQDFGTVKGMSLEYDMRRTGNVRLVANYTLQFANGTSSSADAQRGTIQLIGNLRTTSPLSFDERHRLTVSLDYRYFSGRKYTGPEINGKQIFADAGLNILMIAASGRPYTVAQLINGPYDEVGFEGSFNGARLPWNTRIDLRLDKDIKLRNGVLEGENKREPLFVNVYFRVQNVLDSRNQTGTYRFSQSPYDTGYLSSARGISDVNQNADPVAQAAFVSAYQWSLVNPGFFTFPRRMYVGAVFQF
jgi:hypothetical protein